MMAFDLLHKQSLLNPDKVALVDTMDGREKTYAALNDRASRLARLFTEKYGLAAGDRVAMLCMNTSEFYEVLFACAKVQLVLVPLNWRLSVTELKYIVDDCTPSLFIADPEFVEPSMALWEQYGDLPALVLGADAHGRFEAVEPAVQAVSAEPVTMPTRDGGDIWYLIYTSGTTGKPKGVIQTFEMALANYLNIGTQSALTFEDTSLNVLPQFHVGGINLYTMPTLFAGGTALLMRSFDPRLSLKLLAERTTVFLGVPAVYLMLQQQPEFETTDFSGMRCWASGGAPMPTAVIESYARHGIVIQQGFGMSETGPTVFLIDKDHALSKAGSVGRPLLFVDCRVVDERGQDRPANEAGELILKGPGITPGYWNLPDKTAEAFNKDGWFVTGDIAKRDEENYFYIVDRSKDMFISGGENVYPAEVENVLFQHEAVAEVAVIGLPDEKWGEIGLAAVVLKKGHTLDADTLIDFCKERLAKYKVPKLVRFIDALPRNAAGKVVKPELRKQFAS